MHADAKLYLVFEFLDVDLKRYIENGNKMGNPISLELVKVSDPVMKLFPRYFLRSTGYFCFAVCMVDACFERLSRPNTSLDGGSLPARTWSRDPHISARALATMLVVDFSQVLRAWLSWFLC